MKPFLDQLCGEGTAGGILEAAPCHDSAASRALRSSVAAHKKATLAGLQCPGVRLC